jgi:hypothetical protein
MIMVIAPHRATKAAAAAAHAAKSEPRDTVEATPEAIAEGAAG